MLPHFFYSGGNRVGGLGIRFMPTKKFGEFLARHFSSVQRIQYRCAPAVIGDFHAHAAVHHAR
jgi:hypothetical protein